MIHYAYKHGGNTRAMAQLLHMDHDDVISLLVQELPDWKTPADHETSDGK